MLLDSIEIESMDMKKRSVKHYGYEFLYSNNNVDGTKPMYNCPIPASCNAILKRMSMLGHIDLVPDQLTVNLYQPGQGIKASWLSCKFGVVYVEINVYVY